MIIISFGDRTLPKPNKSRNKSRHFSRLTFKTFGYSVFYNRLFIFEGVTFKCS